MKAFVASLTALFILIVLIAVYGVALRDFTEQLTQGLMRLPDTPEAFSSAPHRTQAACTALLQYFEKHELLLHLGIPYERAETAHEAFLELATAARAQDASAFLRARALCLEEAEILHGFEDLSLTNLL